MKTTFRFARVIIFLFLIFGLTSYLHAQTPTLEFKFANPEINIENSEICYDLEIQADEENYYIEVINVNVFIDNAILAFNEFRDQRYEIDLQTNGVAVDLPAGAGSTFFGFTGEAIWIQDILQSTNNDLAEDKLIATYPNWSYVVKTCFFIVDTIYSETQICPPIVWNQDTDGDSFSPGAIGFQSVVYNATSNNIQVNEFPHHANWELFNVNTDLGPCAELFTSTEDMHSFKNDEITLSPNPARDHLKVQILGSNTTFTEFEIFASNGLTVTKFVKLSSSLSMENVQNIDISALQEGIYILKLSNNETSISKRFIKF